MRKPAFALAGALTLALGSFAFAQDKLSGAEFAAMAASSDMFEIQSSELAVQNAKSAEVKSFAQQMIQDHTKASKNLMMAAEKDNVPMKDAMMEKHAAQLQALSGASGDSFDAAYVEAQVAAHEEALNLMTSYAQNGESVSLQSHAKQTAPVIQMHYEHVQTLEKSM